MGKLKDERAKLYYGRVMTDIGRLWVAVSPRGVRRVEFDMAEQAFVARLRQACGCEPVEDQGAFSA